ncbi:LysR family transcriptional regulator [Sphaerotilus mobilis]|uniref:DNA-binding transcriptional LysR family regulator n=1 Tax=Sphaerotilus mobilis TaxID=47994 RepID=A0A4V2EVQ4_9BURK|nr:LysR family transcriptional regulator [Sphaerotilus mobilis]RZS53300.1 DNA-binding transcriptional LysR family regulator [Sphaerotilus mobilis]
MSKPDHLHIDGRLLQLLVTVLDTGSVTAAAQRLGVTQSAVSHGLERLRAILGDPLFVKSGRGIAPTERARSLALQARDLLAGLQRLAEPEHVDPASLRGEITIAANELQCHLLLPPLLLRLRQAAPGLTLRILPSRVPGLELLRDESCQLVISPRPPDSHDVLQKRLFADRYRVWYDARERAAPTTLADYLAADHVSVRYEDRRRLDIDEWFLQHAIDRHIVVTVPGFSGIAPFLRGTTRLATLPSLLATELLRDLAHADIPLPEPLQTPPLPMYLLWHRRHQDDAVQRWVRGEVEGVVLGMGIGIGYDDR